MKAYISPLLAIVASSLVVSTAQATIPVVDAAANSQLVAQLLQMTQQLEAAERQVGQLQSILGVNEQSLQQVTSVMDTLGTTKQFKENNAAVLGQINELSQSNLTQGLGDQMATVSGAGGGGSLLEGFAGLTQPLGKVANSFAEYGGQAFDIFSGAQDLYETAQGMMDGSTGVIEGIASIGETLFGGGSNNPYADRLNEMSVEEMIATGQNLPASVGSMWRQQTLATAEQNYKDQIQFAQRRQKLTELAEKAETQADHQAVQQQFAILEAEQRTAALNMQSQQLISNAAGGESDEQRRAQESARRMGTIQANRFK